MLNSIKKFLVVAAFCPLSTLFAAFPESGDTAVLKSLPAIRSLHIEESYYPQERHISALNSLPFPTYFTRLGMGPTSDSEVALLERLHNRYFRMRSPNSPSDRELFFVNRYGGSVSLDVLFNLPNQQIIERLQKSRIQFFQWELNRFPSDYETQILQKLPALSLKFQGCLPANRDVANLNRLVLSNLDFEVFSFPSYNQIRELKNLARPFRLFFKSIPTDSNLRDLLELSQLKEVVFELNNYPTQSDVSRLNRWGRDYILSLVMHSPYPDNSYELGQAQELTHCRHLHFKAATFPQNYQQRYMAQLNRPYTVQILPSLATNKGSWSLDQALSIELEPETLEANREDIQRSPVAVQKALEHRIRFQKLHLEPR